MTHDEMIAVIEHHKNGGEIQCLRKNVLANWVDTDGLNWNFTEFDYRIKPEPMTLWLEISDGKVIVTHYEKPLSRTYANTTLKKFVEVTE